MIAPLFRGGAPLSSRCAATSRHESVFLSKNVGHVARKLIAERLRSSSGWPTFVTSSNGIG
jgi:hypothetical protein